MSTGTECFQNYGDMLGVFVVVVCLFVCFVVILFLFVFCLFLGEGVCFVCLFVCFPLLRFFEGLCFFLKWDKTQLDPICANPT